MHRLSRRVRQLEKQSGADERFVLLPLPGKPGEFVGIPRPFADWLAERCPSGRHFNRTDGQWEGC